MGNKSSSKNLHDAKQAKNDEFYTQLPDIERELIHYKQQFKDKVVLCNCDDPYESNFFKHLAMKFNDWKLKKLIATCYTGSPVVGEEFSLLDVKSLKGKTTDPKLPYKIEIAEVTDANSDGAIGLSDVKYLLINKKNTISLLKGDGDFRSSECIELLKESDIVVTNPPFSLFREYVAQLMKHRKQFVIIGSLNAITYSEFFRLIKENKLWLGYGFKGGNAYFKTPFLKEFANGVYNEKTGLVKFRNVTWYTNLDVPKRHDKLILQGAYNPEKHPTYDNFDAINVDKISNIPCNYKGAMGVPISFLDKYNPEQFEILGNEYDLNIAKGRGYVNGKRLYGRVFIRNKEVGVVI